MTIHLWHTHRLARDLANDALSERDAAGYLMLAAVLYAVTNYSALWFGANRDWTFLLELLMVIMISLVGVYECYKANGREQGQHFLLRYCALGVPVGLKIAIASTALGHGINFIFPHVATHGTFRDPALLYRFIYFVMALAWTFIYFWRVAYHLERIRSTELARGNAL